MAFTDMWDLHRQINQAFRDAYYRGLSDDWDWDLDRGTGTNLLTDSNTRGGDTQLQPTGQNTQLSRSNDNALVPRINLDLIQEKDRYVVHAEVPGVRKENMQLSVKDGLLTIHGEKKNDFSERKDDEETGSQFVRRERRFGSFTRSLRLPEDAADQNIDAKFENGMLKITIPRQEKKKAQGNIMIQ